MRKIGAPALAIILFALLGACSPTRAPEGTVLRIGGSSAARDVVEAALEEFALVYPDVRVEHVPSTHSGAALKALRSGQIDLAYVNREPTAAERRSLYIHPYALDPLVFVAHRGAGVPGLTTQQIRRIYAGDIRRWSEVGGADLPITVLDRPEYTSPKVLLRHCIFSDLEITPGATVLEAQADMNEALSTYPGSLGYTSLRAALARDATTAVLRVDGVYPTPETVRSGRYRMARPILFAVRNDPAPGVRRFLGFATSPRGKSLAESRALVPVRRAIRVGVPPVRNIVALESKYGGLARYLQDRLGRPVELVHEATYTDLTEAFRKGEVDAAFAGSFAYLVAHQETGAEALARPDHHGVSHYRGVIYVRADSPYRRIEDLAGARVVHAGRTTTAGQIFPLYALKVRGLPPPERFFGSFRGAGSHEEAIRAVLEGRADAAAAKDLVLVEMVREEPEVRKRLRELAASPPVPSNAFVAGPLLSPSLRVQIRNLLLTMDQSPQGRKALVEMGADRFLVTTDDDYANLYEMASAVSDALSGYFQYR